MKFIIIDGQFLIYKSLFSHMKLTTTFNDKEIISGIPFGFLKAIIDMKVEFNPDYIFVTWEGHPLIKKSAYTEYKVKRKPMEIDISIESEITKAILKSLYIPNLFCRGFEGEDVANHIRLRFNKKKNFGYLYTNDNDAFAMIRKRFILINNVDGDFLIMDKEGLMEEKGITPKEAKEIKILEGCKSDNVAGFKGIGGKYAKYLIKKYGTAKNVVNNINEIDSKYVKLNTLVKNSSNLLSVMTNATKILNPKYVTYSKVKIKNSYIELLEEMECHTLLKGINKKIMKLIIKDQKKHKTNINRVLKARKK